MIHHKRVVQGIVTGLILVPILITAFLPGRMAKTQAASDPADSSSVDHSTTAAIIPSSPVQPSAAPLPASSRRHVTSTRAVPLTRTDTSVVLMPDASAAYAPSATQTSSFLYGSVAVKVLFVESTVGDENWTETEVGKVKSEVAQALDWWTVAATVPAAPGQPARPSAQLSWDVSYVSPFDGSSADRDKIQVDVEPIKESVFTAAANWIPQVAAAFVGGSGPSAVRALADETRNAAEDDWGFVLFVVDSSADADGYFDDDLKASGAALNGPWAVVTYSAGEMGTENLEILIAKMVGHVFGAGDETANDTGGCYNEEMYGYLQVAHDNCERSAVELQPSLMRDEQNMFDAYQEFQLSESARAEVGWRDSDGDGVYDVVDTLSDSFTGISPAPVCPTLHLTNLDINNTPALPTGITDPDGAQWSVHVWDPESDFGQGAFEDIQLYTPVNINRPSFVWGRIDGGDWVEGSASDGAWDEPLEAYNILLPGEAGVNQVEIAIMDRWAQVGYRSPTPVSVTVARAPTFIDGGNNVYESNDPSAVDLWNAAGFPGGWTAFSPPPPNGYSGDTTMISNTVGAEACFAFTGNTAKIIYSRESSGTANVYVDGELHSSIVYTNAGQQQAEHYIANLPSGSHTVQIFAASGVIDFDAFEVVDPLAAFLIDALDPADLPVAQNGFYEQSGYKLLRVGEWSTTPLDTGGRPAPGDSAGLHTARPYDRLYAFFTNANVAAIYRGVFPGGGTAYVYVDGEYRGYMDNDAAYTAVMPFYIGGLDPGAVHTVEVRVNPDAPYFDFDALRLLDFSASDVYAVTTPGQALDIQYNGGQEPYGDWQYVSRGTYIRANDEGDLQDLYFQGSAVSVLVKTNSRSGGIMDLYVDGRPLRTVNLRTRSAKEAPIVLHGFDPSLPHVLQVRHHNENPARPKWSMIEGYRVYYIPPVGVGEYEEYQYDASGNPTESAFIYEQTWKFPSPYTREPGPSDDRYVQSQHPESRAYLYFTGADTLTLYAVAKRGYGTAELWVDGDLKGLFNLHSPSTRFDVSYTLTGMDPTKVHVLEIRVMNLKRKIALDRVVLYNRPVLGPGTYENDGLVNAGGSMVPALQISGQWSRVANASASGTYDMARSIEDQIVFNVMNATSVVIYRRLYRRYRLADVYVDGQYYLSFDNYASSPLAGVYQQPYVIAGLDPTFNHEIKIMPQRFGRRSNHYKPFDVDYIEVRTGDAPGANYLLPGYHESDEPTALAGNAISYVGSSWLPGDKSVAHSRGDKAVILFQGNAFTIFFDKTDNGGRANVSIDGQLIGTFYGRAGSTVENVPFSAGSLSDGLHTAEISVVSGTTTINGYQVYQLTPESGPTTFDLVPTDSRILMSEEWYVENGYLKTREKDARLIMYVTGGDALFITHESWSRANSIEVYINGQLHTTLDSRYLRSAPRPESTYVISGLTGMQSAGYWVEIRNPRNALISLKRVEVASLSPGLAVDQSVEAEGTDVIYASGLWQQRPSDPDVRYSGGFYLRNRNQYAAFYIPTQEDVRYVTVYRNLGGYGDANVYIDGEFWGTMPNRARLTRISVPFTIGPIPKTPGMHIIELRPANRRTFVLDRVVGQGSTVLQPGTYDDNDPRLLYAGGWTEFADSLATGGSMHRSSRRGDQMVATFMGNEITFTFRTTRYGNTTTAYIDGAAYPINTKSGTTVYGVTHTILLPSGGPHSLVLANARGRLELDGINIRSRAPAQYGAYQNDASQVVLNTSDTWATELAADHSGGSYVWTNHKYASAFLLFYGQRVTTYMTTGNNWGKVSFYIDGQLYEKVVLYVRRQLDTPFYAYEITGLPAGNHVLEVRFEGERDGRRGKKRANFDVFTVGGAPVPQPGETPGPGPNVASFGCFEEDNPGWTLSGPDNAWTLVTDAGASGDQYYEASAWENVYAEFDFAASGFSLLFHKTDVGGNAELYVDGLYVDTIDMSGSGGEWLNQAEFDVTGLNPNVLHVVRLVHAGGGFIYLDRLDLPAYDPAYNDACPN